jgi:hypothetical protein
MATFPTTNKTFTTKSNGNTIDASHINDMQDEIAAIEDGYLNGTARLNAGASTVTSLSVSGNSTMAGNLTVSGNLTVTGTASLSLAPPSVRVSKATDTQITAGSLTILSWPTDKWISVASMHSTGTNPERLIPPTTGTYLITASISYAGNAAAGACGAFLRVDGSTYIASQVQAFSTVGSEINIATVSAPYRFGSTTQYVEAAAFRTGANSTVIASGDLYPWFSMTRLG